MNKKWYLIDDKGDWFETELSVKSQQEAIEEAISTWNALSEHDKGLRKGFWVAQYGLADDGIDFDTEEYYVNILDIVR